MHRHLATAALAAWGVWLATPALADETACYEIEEVNVVDDDGTELYTSWWGVDKKGLVAGNYCIDPDCAVEDDGNIVGGAIYDMDSGTFDTFSLPGDANWVGDIDVNHHGLVVGQALESEVAGGVMGAFVGSTAFVRDADGTLTILDPPVEDCEWYGASGVNKHGVVAGFYTDPDDGRTRGFVWEDGSYTLFDASDTGETYLLDVSDKGVLAGWMVEEDVSSGFIDDDGDLETITYPGLDHIRVMSIDKHGAVVGYAYDDWRVEITPFLYEDGDFVSMDFDGAGGVRTTDLDDHGVVVGTDSFYSYGYILTPETCED